MRPELEQGVRIREPPGAPYNGFPGLRPASVRLSWTVHQEPPVPPEIEERTARSTGSLQRSYPSWRGPGIWPVGAFPGLEYW